METERSRYLSAKEAAAHLGFSVFSIYRLVERRAIPFIPVCPSGTRGQAASRPSIRFDVRALDAWMQKRVVRPLATFVDALPDKH
jgi:hypothetical protein